MRRTSIVRGPLAPLRFGLVAVNVDEIALRADAKVAGTVAMLPKRT